MTKQPNEAEIGFGLDAISNLSRSELVDRWQQTYGRPPPKGFGRRLLELSAAYHLQASVRGGLKPKTIKRLRALAEPRTDRNPTDRFGNNPKPLSVGSRLIREWHGNTYAVDVIDNGFLFNGKTYKSLSKVAKEITGAHWSGRRFFGL